MKIVIPTYKRLNKQITLQFLKPLRDVIWLVVRPEEEAAARALHSNVAVIDTPVRGIAETLQWICTRGFPKQKIWVCDDDLRFCKYTPLENKKYVPGKYATENELYDLYAEIVSTADTYYHGGCHQHTVAISPHQYPYRINSRYCTNKWYNGERIDMSTLDFTSIPVAEDFNVMLQLFDRGYDCLTFYKWGAYAAPTNSPGGCSEYRTLQMHNDTLRALADAFPQYVTLKTKIQTSGPWAHKEKASVHIRMSRSR